MEWLDIFWVILALFKEDVAAVLLAAAGKSFEETLLILLLGSSFGVTLFYNLREIILFLGRFRKEKKWWPNLPTFKKQDNFSGKVTQENDLTDYFFSLLKKKFQLLVERIRRHHVLPPLSLFLLACLPVPSLIWAVIVASWVIRQRFGLLIILAGTVIKTLILTLLVFGFMSGIKTFFS